MQIRWRVVGFASVLALGLALVSARQIARAALPLQGVTPAPAASEARVSRAAPAAQQNPGGISIPDSTSAINSAQPMSQRVVHYEIEARYDPTTHAADATEVLTYHNVTGQALDHFPFHLYLNAFQPKATWITEARNAGTRDEEINKWESKFYGAEEIKRFEVVGQGDLTSQLQFVQADDGNKDDKSVVDVHLPTPIAPGAFVQFKIAFHDQFPETLARTGWKRDFLLGGQWFPKVGVWWQGAWNCHQFHAFTEFFADFGVYDVKLTVPQYEVIGASGIEVSSVDNPDKTKTVTYHGDDIHDFAWTVSPRYKVRDAVYQSQMGPIKLRFLMQPGHWDQAERHERITRETLDRFEKWYGPYPYKTLTVVDPEPDSAAGGMEYPTFITGGTSWFAPKGLLVEPEEVVEHEFGHQYWYGMVATNEFEDAWMDEGINEYTQVKVEDDIFGPYTSVLNQWGITSGEGGLQHTFYSGTADYDPIAQKAYDYYNFNSYGAITYAKTACTLLTLEGIIGEDTMQKAMHTYFMRYRFTHPVKEDFLKTIEEVSGKDLRWYFNQAIYGSQVMDYEVARIDSSPADWFEEKKDEKKKSAKKDVRDDTLYNSYVWLHRKGEFIMPLELEVVFSDGKNTEKVREHWDGKSRWTRFDYQKQAKIVSAEIDPDHKVFLDRNDFNNSSTLEPNPKPALKLTNYWLFATQWISQFLAWWGV